MLPETNVRATSKTWWCHYIYTVCITYPLCGKSHVDSQHKTTVMQTFKCFFAVSIDKMIHKQQGGRWNKTPYCSCYVTFMHNNIWWMNTYMDEYIDFVFITIKINVIQLMTQEADPTMLVLASTKFLFTLLWYMLFDCMIIRDFRDWVTGRCGFCVKNLRLFGKAEE